jgi:dipeptide transport system substrate-binding protein
VKSSFGWFSTSFLILLLGPTAWADVKSDETAANKTFIYCSETKPATFNPQLAADGATFNASARTIYNRLVEIDKSSSRVVPSLAESWTVSDDGRELTFKLRAGVQFQTTDYFKPTRNFSADDVIFSIERMRNPKHPFHNVGGGYYPNFSAQQVGQIDRIEKIDDLTVRFILHRPEAPFISNLAMEQNSILSAEYGAKLLAEKKAANIDTLPVGTGPFGFVWYEKDKSVHYRAHPNYFDGAPKIDRLIFLIVHDPQMRVEKLKRGECHFISEPVPTRLSEIRKDPDLKLMSVPGPNISYLAMNVEKPPFSLLNVRKAMNYALNRESYIQHIYDGNAQLAKNPVPPTMWAYNRFTPDFEFNIEKAKALLKSAGLSSGFEIDLHYARLARPYNPDPYRMAEMIKKDLGAVGIKVNLVELEWQDFLKKSRTGELQLSLQGWTSDNGDPDNLLNNLLSCGAIGSGYNRARWCDKRYSFLVERARVTSNLRIRTKFYEEAQDIFKREVPWVTIAHSTVFRASRKNVEGYQISPFDIHDFSKVYFK